MSNQIIFKSGEFVTGDQLLAYGAPAQWGADRVLRPVRQVQRRLPGCRVHGPDAAPGDAGGAVGQAELAMCSSTIWLCASCQTCSARCPMELRRGPCDGRLAPDGPQRGHPAGREGRRAGI